MEPGVEIMMAKAPPPVVYSNEVLERAYKMANVQWTPLKPVPMYNGEEFSQGVSVRGVPYSSVKEINTYLFQDVSYHTFMTAVHNPNSVLYSEDISKAPYHGENCATYYGAVCSSAVMYALGFSIPYYANQIVDLPYMHKLASQVVDSLRICDVIWSPGHVQMVYSTDYRDSTLYKIRLFECAGRSAHIKECLLDDFKKEWKERNYVGYRYEKIIYTDEVIKINDFESIEYNDDLCPSKGDQAVYRTDEDVIINLFNHNYPQIVLRMNDQIISSERCTGDSHVFYGLKPGIYSVVLQDETKQTNSVSFEVVDTNINCTVNKDGNILIKCRSFTEADYVCLCDLFGNSSYYHITDECKEVGAISLPLSNSSKRYCKVVFKGEYGRIASRPVGYK